MTPTPQEQLVCNAKKVFCCFKGNQGLMMAALIAYVAELTGMPIDCATLKSNAAAYACLPPNAQLPALIYLMTQVVANGSGTGVGEVVLFSSGGLGTPPPFIPPITNTSVSGVTTGAVATDVSTGQQWNFYNGIWQ